MKWERGEVYKGGSEERTGRVWRCRKWECTKKYHQNATGLAFGLVPSTPLGLSPHVIYFRKFFSGANVYVCRITEFEPWFEVNLITLQDHAQLMSSIWLIFTSPLHLQL